MRAAMRAKVARMRSSRLVCGGTRRFAPTPVTPFTWTDPSFNNGIVRAIVDDGNGGKFVGGSFTSVTCNVTSTTYTTGYTRLIHLLPNGEVDADWSCAVTGLVRALAFDAASDRLYVGGFFSGSASIGGENRDRLAAVTASTGVVVSDWTCNISDSGVNVLAFDAASDRLYVGGNFTISIGGVSRERLAAVTASTGVTVTGWTCNVSDSVVSALAFDAGGDRLYVGGGWSTSIGGESKLRLAAVTASTGVTVTGWTCNVSSGGVLALAIDAANDRLYVGGSYNGGTIGGESRDRLAAVTASTGVVVTGWTCDVSNGSVWSLAIDAANDGLYVGGNYSGTIGGESRTRLAAVTASTGVTVTGWTCNVSNNFVYALAINAANDVLHAGGDFNGATVFDGVSRDRFGTANATAGGVYVP